MLAGVAELRRVIAEAEERRKLHRQRTILFVDEVHRWNKAQQDALLPHVETGMITLIGATTENPYFEVIRALVSRSRIFQLHPLNEENLGVLIDRALERSRARLWAARGAHRRGCAPAPDRCFRRRCAQRAQRAGAGGRMRPCRMRTGRSISPWRSPRNRSSAGRCSTIRTATRITIPSRPLSNRCAARTRTRRCTGWPRCWRPAKTRALSCAGLIILAGEDIGLADPQGLVVATAAASAFEFIGLPEGIYPIAEATLYLATAPKSNSAGAYFKAAAEIEEHGAGPVPIHLMDASRDAKGLGHGQGYQYPHSFPGHFIPQQYLPSNLLGTVFYEPSDQGYEARIAERMARLRELQAQWHG